MLYNVYSYLGMQCAHISRWYNGAIQMQYCDTVLFVSAKRCVND